jgi:predicted anti-sigma-YlaC factor YlaD
MGCQHLEDHYELFLLGVLSDQNAQDIREHLANACPDCRTRFREAVETIYLLSLACEPVRPHPRVRSGLLERIQKK